MRFDITWLFCLYFIVDSNLYSPPCAVKVQPLTPHFCVKVCIQPPVLVQAGFNWVFTEALWVILALLNPILFCECGAQPPSGMWRWTMKPARWLWTQRAVQFFILIAHDISKVAECRPRRDIGRKRGRKSEKHGAQVNREECSSTSSFCSP